MARLAEGEETMRELTVADFQAASVYAARNPSDPFARARAQNRLMQGHVRHLDVRAGHLDDYAPPAEQYIVRELGSD
jgi:hypothetical protein